MHYFSAGGGFQGLSTKTRSRNSSFLYLDPLVFLGFLLALIQMVEPKKNGK
ncbi:hypothetical protein MSUIS_05030 [Mycoplasma suis KI3806]|uniref:Uncharacterized protein n=1 Tax=Mycoplasma suis (strain KI_3806) TaxID=708248 RepID=F0V1R5_MYCS3|nr:hypothetical protein MSUIS_05030 [Mycoplasma suis KI3806]